MLLHADAAAALQRHAAADGASARGWLVGVAAPRLVVLSAARLAAGCADLAADLGACPHASARLCACHALTAARACAADVAAQLPAPLRVLGPYAGGDEASARAACASACAALRGGAALTAAASGESVAAHRFFNAATAEALPAAPAPEHWLRDTFAVLRCRVR